MPRKKRKGSDFGARLAALRKDRGLTQIELATAIGSTQRAISYYETEGAYPPAPVVADIAGALDVTTDELLGRKRGKPLKGDTDPETQRLWRKFKLVRSLPEKDQRAVLRLINSLVGLRQDEAPASHAVERRAHV